MGRRGRVLITNLRGQAGDQHQGPAQILRHPVRIGFQPPDTVLLKGSHAVAQQADRLDHIVGQDRHEYVELEIALGSAEADGRIISHDLDGDHRDGFALGGIDFAGHDGTAGLILGNADLPDPAPGPGSQPAYIIGDLHQIGRQGFQGTAGKYIGVFGGQGMELIGGGPEAVSCQGRDLLRAEAVEAGRTVQACTDGRPADGQVPQMVRRLVQHAAVLLQHGPPAADLLGKAQGDRVLQVGAADLDDILILLFQTPQGIRQAVQGRIDIIPDGQNSRHIHGCREGIVGALGHIDMVIGMDLQARMILGGDMGNDLIDIHIALGTAAGLPDLQGKFMGIASFQNAGAGFGNGLSGLPVQSAQLHIGGGAGGFEDREGPDDLGRYGFGPYGKVLQTSLGLGAPEMVSGHSDLPHRIMLDSVFHALVLSVSVIIPPCLSRLCFRQVFSGRESVSGHRNLTFPIARPRRRKKCLRGLRGRIRHCCRVFRSSG